MGLSLAGPGDAEPGGAALPVSLAGAEGLRFVLVRGPAGGPPGAPCGFVYRARPGGARVWVLGLRRDAATPSAVATCLGLLLIDQALGVLPPERPGAPGVGLLLRDGSTRGAGALLSEHAQWEVRRVAYGLAHRDLRYVWGLAATLRDGRPAPGLARVPEGHPLRNPRLEQFLAPEPPLVSLLSGLRRGG